MLCASVYALRSYFNSRPSARGDYNVVAHNQIRVLFQFTPLREGRLRGAEGVSFMARHFNSRPSARGDAEDVESKAYKAAFQFTPLREGRR